MKIMKLAILGIAATSLSACATVTRGTTDAWVVETDPAGARVETSNGHLCKETPCAIKMPRKSEFTATVVKEGYETVTVTVTHKTAGAGAAGMAGNVLVGGIIGIGVDAASGATQDLVPNPVVLKLQRLGETAAAASQGDVQVAKTDAGPAAAQ